MSVACSSNDQALESSCVPLEGTAAHLHWSQSAALVEPFAVTLDCCTVHAEALSGLAL